MTLNEYNLKRRQAFQEYSRRLDQIYKEQQEAVLAYTEKVKALDKEFQKVSSGSVQK